MKKLYMILCLFVLGTVNLIAQTTGGPDAYGYVWRNNLDAQGPTYNWIVIDTMASAQQINGLADDNNTGSFAIGFPFHYYWYDVTQFWVGSNGYLGFTNGQLSAPFAAIPGTANPQNFLAAFASDLLFDPSNSAKAWRWTNAANDTLIVTWKDVPFYDAAILAGSGLNTFQVILSAVDSSITYQYFAQSASTPTINASIGIENNSGLVGLQHSLNTYPTPGLAVKFYYPANTTFAVSDASTISNSNSETAGVHISKSGQVFPLSTTIKNTGNQPLSPFNVFGRVVNASNVIQVQNTVPSNSLAAGQSQTINMTNSFNPINAGIFRFINDTQLGGDATPSNNQKVQEVVVVDTTAASILLSFDNGIANGVAHSWSGGVGGVGVHYTPPFYPCQITDVLAYISANVSGVGYSMVVKDDSGPNNQPGAVLDSIGILPGSVVTSSWNTTTLAVPLTINSGGVYVMWLMDGPDITLGTNTTTPRSNQNVEYVNGVTGAYRGNETTDLMINMRIKKISSVGITDNSIGDYFANFYPNPVTTEINIKSDVSLIGSVYTIYDNAGKLVLSGKINSENTLIELGNLSGGIYLLNVGDKTTRTFKVVKE
jgi:hypothetical protein